MNMKLLFSPGFLVLTLSGSALASITTEQGVDRPGMDYVTHTLAISDGPDRCLALCRADNNCRAYTFVAAHTIQGPLPKCWLKSAVPAPVSNLATTSGVKSRMTWEPGYDRAGSDYAKIELRLDQGPVDCYYLCDSDIKCNAFTFVAANTIQGPKPICWLKSGIPGASSNAACTSGYKYYR